MALQAPGLRPLRKDQQSFPAGDGALGRWGRVCDRRCSARSGRPHTWSRLENSCDAAPHPSGPHFPKCPGQPRQGGTRDYRTPGTLSLGLTCPPAGGTLAKEDPASQNPHPTLDPPVRPQDHIAPSHTRCGALSPGRDTSLPPKGRQAPGHWPCETRGTGQEAPRVLP